ncbi:MAG: hypothetical protein KatS3mg057_0262 [Herpetosiphonaceae bacterium]|nr:MAG: hypothetical protein KatS3mg057_0262 [Herpetosiphonaceae bacterium]
MTILDPIRSEAEEREQRRASLLLTLLVIIVVAACIFFSFVIFIPSTKQILVGSVSDFPINQPVERVVPQLSMTSFIRGRPDVSEDLIYVTHRANGTWQALLGIDVQSGCFLLWNSDRQRFEDGCSGRSYDLQGQNISEDRRQPDMAQLPVEVESNLVYVVDRLCTEARPCP